MTIASVCNRELRMNRMVTNSIATEPLWGWKNKMNQSKVALEWLYWQEHCLQSQAYMAMSEEDRDAFDLMELADNDGAHPLHQTRIQHVGNAGEYKIPESRYFVDGYDATTNTVYEFHGCFWHAYTKCFPNRHEPHKRHLNRTMNDIRQLTQRKVQFLRDKSFQVVECWECEWEQQKTVRPEIEDYVNGLD